MSEIVRKEVCRCENCGNEAEMVITCSLESVEAQTPKETSTEKRDAPKPKQQVKGSATCTHCGNEADMWLDL